METLALYNSSLLIETGRGFILSLWEESSKSKKPRLSASFDLQNIETKNETKGA